MKFVMRVQQGRGFVKLVRHEADLEGGLESTSSCSSGFLPQTT